MRVVLDTNVFVSGVFFSGPPYEILEAWRDKKLELIVSPPILEEYRRVGKKLADQFSGVDLTPILSLIAAKARVIDSEEPPDPVCDDPDDDKFIACAISGEAEYIVSGDKHLLKINGYEGISIVKPRQFLERHL
jgi:putative PIN family toxin of toxin-antitoxin system